MVVEEVLEIATKKAQMTMKEDEIIQIVRRDVIVMMVKIQIVHRDVIAMRAKIQIDHRDVIVTKMAKKRLKMARKSPSVKSIFPQSLQPMKVKSFHQPFQLESTLISLITLKSLFLEMEPLHCHLSKHLNSLNYANFFYQMLKNLDTQSRHQFKSMLFQSSMLAVT